MTNVLSFVSARSDRESIAEFRMHLCRQIASDYDELAEDLRTARGRVSRARTFGTALEHYARALRRYHQLKGVFTKLSRLKDPDLLYPAGSTLAGEMFVVGSQIELVDIALTSQDPWKAASGMRNFQRSASAMLQMAEMMAIEGARAARAVAGGSA